MISLFQTAKPAPDSELPLHSLSSIVQSLQLNLIRAKSLNHQSLSADMDRLLESLALNLPAPAVLALEAETCSAIHQYFRSLAGGIDSVGTDLAISIRAMAAMLHKDSGAQVEFLDKLEKVQDRFQSGLTLDDMQQMRGHFDSCLESLRSEILDAREAHKRSQDDLLQHLAHLNRSVSTLRSTVPQVHTSGPAVSILKIRRMQAIRDRYGATVAQRLVDYVIQILLVRWPAAHDITPFTEECLVVVDSQNVDLDFHRAALRRLAGERIVFTAKFEGHEILLPIAIDWTVIRAPADGDIQEFIGNFLDGMAKKDTQAASLDKILESKSLESKSLDIKVLAGKV